MLRLLQATQRHLQPDEDSADGSSPGRQFSNLGSDDCAFCWSRFVLLGALISVLAAFCPIIKAQASDKDLLARLEADAPLKWKNVILPTVRKLHCTFNLTE